MRSAILKSVLSVALCSIVAMLAMPCQAKTAKDGKYNPVSALAKDQNPLRWQQQLKWTAGAYELEYPELKLLGWREVGVLNNQKDIDEFIAGNVDKDKLYSHVIDYKNKKYEIAPLSQLAKKYEIKIDDNDVLGVAKDATRDQFAQYGMANVPEDLLENYAKEMLKQEKTREALINRAVDVKLIQAIKGAVTLNEEKVSVEDFNKKVSENA